MRRLCGALLSLGPAVVLMVGPPAITQAQSTPLLPPGRLTVRPHEMATATRTPKAGDFRLDSLTDYVVHVPPQCVGTRRCPLVIVIHGGEETGPEVMQTQRAPADKYGMIVLTPTSEDNGPNGDRYWRDFTDLTPNSITAYASSDTVSWVKRVVSEARRDPDLTHIDAALKQVLRKFAIDPDRIAIVGNSIGGTIAFYLGHANQDIFSRVASISPGDILYTTGPVPSNPKAQFFVSEGATEGNIDGCGQFAMAQGVRNEGYAVKQLVGLRFHARYWYENDFLFHWLKASWAAPDSATPAAPPLTYPLPLLTAEAVSKVQQFWTSYAQESDPQLRRRTSETAWLRSLSSYLKEVIVPIGQERASVLMTDMPALAAHYPSVAADLQRAGLSAEEFQAYRVALLSAQVVLNCQELVHRMAEGGTQPPPLRAATVDPTSTLAKNVEFFNAHLGEIGEWWGWARAFGPEGSIGVTP